MRGTSVILAATIAALSAGPAHADEPAQDPPAKSQPPDDDDLTSAQWRKPRPPLDLHWHLLALPEYVVQLAFTPVAMLVTAVERYRLDKRLIDLFIITENIKLTPDVKLAGGEGFGGGLTLGIDQLWGSGLDIGALGRLNGDYEIEVEFERSLASFEGRTLLLNARAERDQNHRFYGIGPDSRDTDRRVLDSEVVEVIGRFDLTRLGALAVTGAVEGGYRYETLGPGTDPVTPPVDLGDAVMPPPDFGLSNHYAMFRARVRFDNRDTEGRPTRGALAHVEGHWSQEVDDAQFSAIGATLDASWFIPLLPDHRVLVLGAGARTAQALLGDHDIPLFERSTLGRKHHMRGYSSYRFVDDHAWWAVAEYRFPIYEYLNTGGAADALFFVEAGQVGDDLDKLFDHVRFDYGIGLRGGYDAANFFELQLGFSSEGPTFGFALGAEL